jgi:hypothetical protein
VRDDTIGPGLARAAETRVSALCDVDNDGDVDAVSFVSWPYGRAAPARVMLNNGSGGFTTSGGGLPPLLADGTCVVTAAVCGDFNSDGSSDVLVLATNRFTGRHDNYLLMNNGSGGFVDRTTVLFAVAATANCSYAAVFDADAGS